MPSIPYTFRRPSGIYVLRRKILFADGTSRPITYSLGTSKWCEARFRAAAACAALERFMRAMEQEPIFWGGTRSASETSALARVAIDVELGFAVKDHLLGFSAQTRRANLVYADFYRMAAENKGYVDLTVEQEARLRGLGRDDSHLSALRSLVRHHKNTQLLAENGLRLRLERLGYRFNALTAEQDRALLLGLMAEAQRRASFFHDPRVQASGSPFTYLLESGHALDEEDEDGSPGESAAPATHDSMVSSTDPPAPQHPQAPQSVDAAGASAGPLLSEVIDQVVSDIVSRGHWSDGKDGTGADARRLLRQFVWIVGDKDVRLYKQQDAAAFAREMMNLPKSVRFGSVAHIPYKDAKRRFPKLTAANKRNPVTMNKDLAYLSRFHSGMESAGYWNEGQINFLSLGHLVSKRTRSKAAAPWRVEHIEKMLHSPIFTGGSGPKKRLRPGRLVHHDAAYWIPLLCWWTIGGCREELSGLLLSEIIDDHPIPHLIIQPNELRGLKRDARERVIPIADELNRLGFLDFVRALRARREKCLFGELYINEGKRGGDQYYNISWRKLVGWLKAEGVELPVGGSGKAADFRSIRSTAMSMVDRHDINQNIVKDIVGHAREGVTAVSYQDLVASAGLEEALLERLAVIHRLPKISGHLQPKPVKLLAMNLRTR